MYKQTVNLLVYFFIINVTFIGVPGNASQMQNVKFTSISIKDGLSQNSINSILQDRTGYLWFGTLDGLNKYDGYTFKTYRKDPVNLNSISDNYVLALFEDQKGIIWIGTYGGGLNKFDPATEQFTRYMHDPDNPNSIGSNSVWRIAEDQSGFLWIGCWRGGLNKFDPEKGIFETIRLDSLGIGDSKAYTTWPVTIDSDNILWAGLFREGLLKYDLNENQLSLYKNNPENNQSLTDNHIRCIFEDRQGFLWLGTSQGMDRLDRKTSLFTHYRNNPDDPFSLSNNDVRNIFEDSQSRLWIATVNGLNLYTGKDNRFIRFNHDQNDPFSISNNRISNILEDKGGILWFGTINGGVNKFDPNTSRFHYFGHHTSFENSLSDNFVKAFYEDDQGILWVGTNNGINKLQKTATLNPFLPFQYKAIKIPISSDKGTSENLIMTIKIDINDKIWIGSWGEGLFHCDRQFRNITNFLHDPDDPGTLSSNYVRSLYQDHENNIWICTLDGLNLFDSRTNRFIRYKNEPDKPGSISSDRINDCYQDSEGIFWIGTEAGLNRFDKATHTFSVYHHAEENTTSISNDRIRVITEDANNNLWIGTDEGLNRYHRESETFETFTTHDGLPNNVIYGILEDNAGYLWISTNWGLSKFDPGLKKFINYTVDHGLQENEFNGRAFFKSETGYLYFGGINGFTYFDPANITEAEYDPPVILTNFTLYNNPVAIGYDPRIGRTLLTRNISETKDLELAYNDDIFSFEFAALDFSNPLSIRYEYMMEGLNDHWINTSASQRFVTFTTLNPGEYRFRVRAAAANREWSKNQAEIRVVIPPPVWATWWFRLLLVLLTLSIFIGFYRYRTLNIRRHNRELEIEIDGRKKTEQELQHTKTYINNIINSMPSVLISIDASNRVTHWNEEAEKMTGIKNEVATGQPLEVVFPRIRKEMNKIKQSIRSKQIITESKLENISENRSQYSDMTIYPLISNGTQGAVIRIDDITERIRLEEMMIQSEKMLSVGGLAAGMAHEINNPLAGIMQNAQVVMNRLTENIPANEEAARASGTSLDVIRAYMEKRKIIDMLESINTTSKRAAKIVENMLSFSRKSESRLSTHDVIKILEDTVELAANDYDLKKKYDFRQIKIQREYATDVPQIVCERSNIQQVLLNILKNGAQAMTEEKLKNQRKKSKEKASCFTFRVRRENAVVRIEIEDNGPGMDEETRKRAFEPFFTTKSVNVGTGLGLSVSYFIITEQHKGNMSIESVKGRGTKVIIHLNISGKRN